MNKKTLKNVFLPFLSIILQVYGGTLSTIVESGHDIGALKFIQNSPLLPQDSSPPFSHNPLHLQRLYLGLHEKTGLGSSVGKEKNTSSVYSRNYENSIYHCNKNGFFLKPGSRRDYYQCDKLPLDDSFLVYEIFCPPSSTFNNKSKTCQKLSVEANLTTADPDQFKIERNTNDLKHKYKREIKSEVVVNLESLNTMSLPTLRRQKRFPFQLLFAGLSALGSLAGAASGIAGSVILSQKQSSAGRGLLNIENKLTGIEGKMKDVQLTVLESQIKSRINTKIIQNLISIGNENNQQSFDVTQKLINRGILENRLSMAATQGLIKQGNRENAANFARMHASIGQLEQFVNEEINEAKSEIRRGFESVSNAIDRTRIEPIVSTLLTLLNEFSQKTNHIHSLPKENIRDEIERDGGYISYLESSTLQNTLLDIIHQNLAVPKEVSDLQAVLVLELLAQGLQVHVHMLSAIVSSNAFLAVETLESRDLNEFNTFMLRVSSSIERLKIVLFNSGGQGLLEEVKKILDKVEQLPYAANIHGLHDLTAEKRSNLDQLMADVNSLITDNTNLGNPGTIQGKPDFSLSNIAIPVGGWAATKKVSYALQFVSENGLSLVGEWSAPYTVQSRACPVIKLPPVALGIIRLVYRRFNEEKPELVAILTDNSKTEFRDISRDLLNAASRQNEDIAERETITLLNDGWTDVNVFLEKEMTPLHYASKYGNVKVMELLVAKGANVQAKSAENQEALHYAALFGAEEGVHYLITKGADVNKQTKSLGFSAMHIAVSNNHVNATSALLRNNAFVNIKDHHGLTPLHLSTMGNGDTIDILLTSQTVDVNAVDEDGLTPLHYAARSSSSIVVSKLLEHKDTDVNSRTTSLLTPLHLASMSGNDKVITPLLNKGAEISAADEDGSIPLHYAAFYGHRKAALELLEGDSLLDTVKNKNGKTPLNLAIENNRQSVAEVLGKDLSTLVEIIRQEKQNQPAEDNQDRNLRMNEINNDNPDNCTADQLNKMFIDSEKTCERINDVENYVNIVMTMIPLRKYYKNHETYSEIFNHYDADLKNAQDHAKLWRNGDSVVSGIRQTLQLAKEFEPEFQRKYKINQERVETVKANIDQADLINTTKARIQVLEKRLNKAQKAKEKAEAEGDDEDMLEFIIETINEIQTELKEEQRKLIEDYTLLPELVELAAFLEFVRRDASKISDMAERTREKTETFQAYLEGDKGAFERHKKIAKHTLEKLQNDTIAKDQELAAIRTKEVELEKKIEEERKKLEEHYKSMRESHEDLRKMRKELMDKMSNSNKLSIAGAIVSIFVPIVGVPLLLVANKQQNEAVTLMQQTMESNRASVDLIQEQIRSGYNEIETYRQLIANSSSNSEKISYDMNLYSTIDGDLITLSSEVEKLLEAIDRAITGVKLIKTIFDHVVQELGEMIKMAKEAKTEVDRLNARYFLFYKLSEMQCHWKDAYHKMMTLDDCTQYFQILY